jgi:hypothetical protein
VPVLRVYRPAATCRLTRFGDLRRVLTALHARRAGLLSFSARGVRCQGSPCEALSHRGFNGIESDVVAAIARWITAR